MENDAAFTRHDHGGPQELPEDVQLLCRDCHERADEKRAVVNCLPGNAQPNRIEHRLGGFFPKT